jgi:glutaredoxin/glutathione-dependent peroxiredoxin
VQTEEAERVTLGVGDRIPDTELFIVTKTRPVATTSAAVLGSGTVVLFAVPGAFTPGCSEQHLPGFVARATEMVGRGVSRVACVSVNDPWVLAAWARDHGIGDELTLLSDGNGTFTRAMGREHDFRAHGLGARSQRYAAILSDGRITWLEADPKGVVAASSCDAVLAQL